MGNEAVQVLKFVLISIQGFQVFFCLHSNFEPIIYCQFTALEFMTSYSQQEFVEESEITSNPITTITIFQSVFTVLYNLHIWDYV